RRLGTINRTAAEESRRRIRHAESAAEAARMTLAIIGMLATFAVGIYSVRMVDRRERQLAENAARLEERNRELHAFAGRLAHELRGPLNTVSIAGGRLAMAPGAERLGGSLRRGVERMDAIIRGLLALSRAQLGDEVCDPRAVTATLQSDLTDRLAEASASLR